MSGPVGRLLETASLENAVHLGSPGFHQLVTNAATTGVIAMTQRIVRRAIATALPLTLIGCMTAGDHASQLHSDRSRRMTVGIVQKEIRKGMAQAEVAAALGSPNIVTRDGDGMESWIYDKIATEASYSSDSGSIGGALGAGGAPGSRSLVLGGLSTGYGKSAGAMATTQRTLTVIIKFNDAGQVDSFSYHSSRF